MRPTRYRTGPKAQEFSAPNVRGTEAGKPCMGGGEGRKKGVVTALEMTSG